MRGRLLTVAVVASGGGRACDCERPSGAGKNLFFTTDADRVVAESDIIFVSVNTPTKTFGIGAGHAANVKNIELAARMIAAVSTRPKIVVEKSTVRAAERARVRTSQARTPHTLPVPGAATATCCCCRHCRRL